MPVRCVKPHTASSTTECEDRSRALSRVQTARQRSFNTVLTSSNIDRNINSKTNNFIINNNTNCNSLNKPKSYADTIYSQKITASSE